MIAALALAWGALLSLPLANRARRADGRARARALGTIPSAAAWQRRIRTIARRVLLAPGIVSIRRVADAPRRARRRRGRDDAMARDLAITVDLVAVAVGAGCTPYLAVDLAAEWAPPAVAVELRGALHACAVGRSFDDALRDLGLRERGLRPLTDTVRTTARLGSPALPALGRLASEVRVDLRRRAEARARTIPVRLCFPLVGCVLPAFALLTVVPVVLQGLHG